MKERITLLYSLPACVCIDQETSTAERRKARDAGHVHNARMLRLLLASLHVFVFRASVPETVGLPKFLRSKST